MKPVSPVTNFCLSTIRKKSTLPFSSVPGPKQFKFLGGFNDALTLRNPKRLHRTIDDLHKKYGPIFKILLGGNNAVFLSSADDMREVFLYEGKYPIHPLPPAWTYYNKKFNCKRGLFFMDGEEWWHYRKMLNPLFLRPANDSNKKAIELACDRLISSFEEGQEIQDLEAKLYLWSIDVILSVMLGPEVDMYSCIPKEKIQSFANKVQNLFITSCEVSSIPPRIGDFFKLNKWIQFENVVHEVIQLGNGVIDEAWKNCPLTSSGLLNSLKNSGLSIVEMQRIFTDMIIAAGDTTSFTMQWSLYLLGKNPIVQKQIQEHLKDSNPTEMESSIVKAVVKETLRMYPTAFVQGRLLTTNCHIGGYEIPAHTMALISLYTSGRRKDHFSFPDKFLPERWNRKKVSLGEMVFTPQASMPFAIGSRSCIGQKIASYQLHALITKILQKFSIEVLNQTEIAPVTRMVLVPEKSIKITLKKY